MSFADTERIIALPPGDVGTLFPALLAQYGEPLPDGEREIVTIGAFWDDAAKTRKRAASLSDGTIQGIPLTDGRAAYRCLWQTGLMAEFDANGIPGVEELTEQQFDGLRVRPES